MRYAPDFEMDQLESSSEFGNQYEGDYEVDGESMPEFDSETFDTEFADFEQEEEAGAGQARRGTGQPGVQNRINQHRMAIAHLRQAIPSMARFVRKEGGRFRFVPPARTLADASAKLRVQPVLVGSLLKSLQQANQRLARRRPGSAEVDMETDFEGEVPTPCPGVSSVSNHWWGQRIMLNECHTRRLLEAMAVAGSAGGLCAAVAPVPQVKVVCGVAGALIGVGAAVINAIDGLGGNKGIIIRRPWITPPPPLPPVVVWHQ